MSSGFDLASRRDFIVAGAAAATLGAPAVLRAQNRFTLDFLTIHDPDGWHPSLRLKGDWLIFAISDGVETGYGEASHSRDDELCRQTARSMFERHYSGFPLSLENLAAKEAELAPTNPDFVTATALSGLNQAFYDLLAKRERVPVWQLFESRAARSSVPLYTTINRALQTRSNDEYLDIVGALARSGFSTFKCAPFERVDGPEDALQKSTFGLRTLGVLREAFPDIGMRVDFHERFVPADFFELIPELERLRIDWLEEPFEIGDDYVELKRRARTRIAGGELFWGKPTFKKFADNGWVDVIMPDVKHVGGFGPLLDVLRMAEGRLEVSPHNPSGPVSTAASLHAAMLFPDTVRSIEFAFDRMGVRPATGERVENGRLFASDRPGWGVEPRTA
jgi:galactonate dehydratase